MAPPQWAPAHEESVPLRSGQAGLRGGRPVRVPLTGGTASRSIYDVVILLGKATALQRLDDEIGVCGK